MNKPTLQEILKQFAHDVRQNTVNDVVNGVPFDEAQTQISQLVDGCIPDKKPDHPKSIYNYNNAIDEMRNNLKAKGIIK